MVGRLRRWDHEFCSFEISNFLHDSNKTITTNFCIFHTFAVSSEHFLCDVAYTLLTTDDASLYAPVSRCISWGLSRCGCTQVVIKWSHSRATLAKLWDRVLCDRRESCEAHCRGQWCFELWYENNALELRRLLSSATTQLCTILALFVVIN